jgi:hypothetical protein
MMMEQRYYDADCDTPRKGWAEHFAEYKHPDTFRVQQGQFSRGEFDQAVEEAKVRAASDLRAGTFKATSMGTLTFLVRVSSTPAHFTRTPSPRGSSL